MKNNVPFTTAFFVITPLLFFISFAIDGLDPLFIPTVTWFFPWACVSLLFVQAVQLPFILLGLLQFPIYDFLLDYFKTKKQRFILGCIIAATHFVLVVIIKQHVTAAAVTY